jgi:hypothetical protein
VSADEQWRWEYDPDAKHVIGGLPDHVVAEVERLAGELVTLAELGIDVTDIGKGPQHGRPGGLRCVTLPIGGWLLMLAIPRMRLIAIVRVVPPFSHL